MKSNFKVSLLCLSLAATAAHADAREVVFNEKVTPFNEWLKSSANEASVLNLHAEFKEPTVTVEENGITKDKTLTMVVYSTRAKTVASKPAVNINLSSLISEKTFERFDPEARHKRISQAQTMPVVVGRGAIANFKWCNRNPRKPDIFLPALERSQAHMSRPGRQWCSADSRTVCFESCRLVPSGSAMEVAIAGYNQLKSPGKDFGIATQSEARYYASESEFGARFPLSSLTGVKTQVSGVLEVSLFYFNQIMVFGKMLVILQADPNNNQKTVVTTLSAFGIRSETWNHRLYGSQVQNLLKSKSIMNSKTGILAGVPGFTRNATLGLAELLEQQR